METSSAEACKRYYEAQQPVIDPSLPPPTSVSPLPTGAHPRYALQSEVPPGHLFARHLAEREMRMAAAKCAPQTRDNKTSRGLTTLPFSKRVVVSLRAFFARTFIFFSNRQSRCTTDLDRDDQRRREADKTDDPPTRADEGIKKPEADKTDDPPTRTDEGIKKPEADRTDDPLTRADEGVKKPEADRTDDPPTRTDGGVRTTTLEVISSVMMNPNVGVAGTILTLEDLMEQCRGAGVSFSELLEIEVEGYDMVPLMIEIIRCDFEGAPDLLLFLLQHTASARKFHWFIRRGCMLRNDCLFEKLRQITPHPNELRGPPAFEYVVSLEQYTTPLTHMTSTPNNTFRALISIQNFAVALDENAQALQSKGRRENEGKRTLLGVEAEPGLTCEIVALGRCWSLEVGANRLILTLIDGVECNLDASVSVLEDELGSDPPDPGVGEMIGCFTMPMIERSGLSHKDPVSLAASTFVELLETVSTMPEPHANTEAEDLADDDSDPSDDEPSISCSTSLDSTNTETAHLQPTARKPILPDITSEVPPFLEDEPHGERLSATYVELIKWAILGSPSKRATVKQIAESIRDEFPFYACAEGLRLLKVGVRQRISTSPLFQLSNELPEDSEDGGGYWIYIGQGADAASSSPALAPPGLRTAPMLDAVEALPVPRANPFVFPQSTLYPRYSSPSKHHVAIKECYPPNAPRRRSNLIGAALSSGQLVLRLVVRLHDELDILNAGPSVTNQRTTSLGATGTTSAVDIGVRVGYKNRAASSTGGWSVVDDDDVLDSDRGDVS
ncbi:hypothetical protein FRB96_001393 [Tulasnella sp. 330]|nr:hypothetical protein FRB96_001393 [Tulasnella sp. 330]